MVKSGNEYTAPVGTKAEETKTEDRNHGKRKRDMATFKLLCQGRDGRLCLFEDADGHFTAVRSDRLA